MLVSEVCDELELYKRLAERDGNASKLLTNNLSVRTIHHLNFDPIPFPGRQLRPADEAAPRPPQPDYGRARVPGRAAAVRRRRVHQ